MMEESTAGQYEFKAIEKKWREYWLRESTFKTPDFSPKPKYYILDMFPYPSGSGLHVGHAEGYTATDVIARFKRMQGFNVLHPMGWDAFGLPAEQYAIKTGTHPKVTTETNINNYRRQIQELGFSTDWEREVNTTDPKYYRWTQWIFLQLFKKGLAYESFEAVNWCPALGTVLANEEVIDGKSEVGGHPVEKRPIRQWVLRITAYADKLLEGLDELDWPESTKEMQRNWIGKSVGADITFKVKGQEELTFQVFTTRPDTLFGASFCVLAPEHKLVASITTAGQKEEIESYLQETAQKSELDRSATGRAKTGAFTGSYAINPANGAALPIFVADYVLAGYGSGAIMAVPGHDERDHEFAKKYELEIIRVLEGGSHDIQEAAYTGEGTLVNSGFLNGLNKEGAKERMCEWLAKQGYGKKSVTYRLRDWIFSRQRYWGEPFPIIRDDEGSLLAVDDSELPVILPDVEDYRPSGTTEPPLAQASSWAHFEKDGRKFSRETNIMPQWAGSCWYYLRYLDPNNYEAAWDPEKEKHWLPVDLYVGGVEHANLHLLYARFWHKVLYDLGHTSTKEPFKKLRHPGLILGSNGEKMSKSRGNVVNPDEVIAAWGSDSLRLYEMFMGPLDQVKPWQTGGIAGVHRFLKRFWRLGFEDDGSLTAKLSAKAEADSIEFRKVLHKTIKRVSEDTEELKFNTAIAGMMELVNAAYKEEAVSIASFEAMVLLLAPYAPHMSEEIWQRLGHKESLAYAPWPKFEQALVQEDEVTLSIMVNGKLRGTMSVAKDLGEPEVIAKAKTEASVQKHLDGYIIRKEIFVPGKIVNFVATLGKKD